MKPKNVEHARVLLQVSASMVPRIEAARKKLSTPWHPMTTASEACVSLLHVGLASLGDATAKPPLWTAGELRLVAEEKPGARRKDVTVRLDKLATRRVEVVRTRLLTRTRWITTAATVRTLVLVGLDHIDGLPAEELSGRLVRFLHGVSARIEALATEQGRPLATMFAVAVRSRLAVAEGREGGHGS